MATGACEALETLKVDEKTMEYTCLSVPSQVDSHQETQQPQ